MLVEAASSELGDGQVQEDLVRCALGEVCLPLGQLPARFGDDPSADVEDQATVLGDVDEVPGGDQPARGVLPAQQGLHRMGGPRRQVDDRLVVQPQLAGALGGRQLGLQLLPGTLAGVCEHVEHLVAVSAKPA